MTNYDIYKLVKFVLRKDDKGYPEILKNFSKLLQQSSLDHFKEQYNIYQQTQEINDSLSPFEVRQAISGLTATATTITLPTDYAHFIGMYWTDSDSYDRAFDLVTDDEWDMRCGSTITIPSDEYPICKIVNSKLYVKPNFGIYDDWFLPSKDAVNAMYNNLHLQGVGGFNVVNPYWSSSELNNERAWYQYFNNGDQGFGLKSDTENVRAIRTFVAASGAYSLRDVGEAGGLIFYIDGTTYYEAAPSDQSTSQAWSNVTSTLIGTTGTAIGTGQTNTTAIIGQSGHTDSAAKLCDDLIVK
jgi:hypothetical protein